MEKKNIFLDTSIFVNQCFCFDNKQFTTLIKLKNENKIDLFITETIKEEVIERIKYSVNNGTKVIKNNAHILGAILDIKKEDLVQKIINNFNDYLKHFTVIPLPKENIGNIIIKNYFKNKPPFDTLKENKKQEFPDAFILETIKYWCNENNKKAIFVSNDKDGKTFINNSDNLIYEESFKKLLNNLNKENDELSLAEKAYKENLLEIENSLEKLIDEISPYKYEIYYASVRDYQQGYIEPDFELENIDIVENPKILEKELIDIDQDSAYYNIKISYQISAEFYSKDYSFAIYDKEDDKWYGVNDRSISNDYEIIIDNIDLSLDLRNNSFTIETCIEELNPVINFYEPID